MKIDDWVETTNGIDRITGLVGNNVDLLINQFSTLEQLELWQPRKGELCILWDSTDDINYAIQEYTKKGKHLDGTPCHFTTISSWTYVAPIEFIRILREQDE